VVHNAAAHAVAAYLVEVFTVSRCAWEWMCGCLLAAFGLYSPSRAAAPPATGEHAPIVVFAAASLTNALEELGAGFDAATGAPIKLSFAASSALARQIESGAPADIFFSADIDWMDYLQSRKLIQVNTRRDVVGNRLVLIAAATSTLTLRIAPHFALVTALGTGRLATGDPDSVPVGRYARAALTALGVWSAVEGHIVGAENVRAALAFVDRGEAPLGIVYKTDALVDKGVRIVDTFPLDTHPPITYPIALTVGARSGAAQFADFLRTQAADAIFIKYGFAPLH